MSCPYKFIFGVPGQGVHSYRIFGLAFVDILGTILLAWWTSYLTHTRFWWNLAVWFVVGEVLHWVFGTPTAFLKFIGLNTNC
jgi:hypothetical protein